MKTRFSCGMNSENPYVDNKLKKVPVQSTCKVKKNSDNFYLQKSPWRENNPGGYYYLLLVDFYDIWIIECTIIAKKNRGCYCVIYQVVDCRLKQKTTKQKQVFFWSMHS